MSISTTTTTTTTTTITTTINSMGANSSHISQYISSAARNLLNVESLMQDQQLHHPIMHNQQQQITFDVPTQHDITHINNMQQQQNQQTQQTQQMKKNLHNLLERFGNAAVQTIGKTATREQRQQWAEYMRRQQQFYKIHNTMKEAEKGQIAQGSVVNMSDMRTTATTRLSSIFFEDAKLTNFNYNENDDSHYADDDWLTYIFGENADVQAIINYLWIGVICTLIILIIIFVVSAVVFYRKFRVWKRCNKEMRTQLQAQLNANNANTNNNNNINARARRSVRRTGLAAVSYHSSVDNSSRASINGSSSNSDSAYYQMMLDGRNLPAAIPLSAGENAILPPPCYTIATGLPSYDEALNRHQHFAYGMRFMYPTTLNVLNATFQQEQQQQHTIDVHSLMLKDETQQQPKLTTATATATAITTPSPPTYSEALMTVGNNNTINTVATIDRITTIDINQIVEDNAIVVDGDAATDDGAGDSDGDAAGGAIAIAIATDDAAGDGDTMDVIIHMPMHDDA